MNDATPSAGWNDAVAWPYDGGTAPTAPIQHVYTIPGTERTLFAYGWICPRCGQVNAPWIQKCDCKPGAFLKGETDTGTVTTIWPEPCETNSAGGDGTSSDIVWIDLDAN
jgi:hypothetical protein